MRMIIDDSMVSGVTRLIRVLATLPAQKTKPLSICMKKADEDGIDIIFYGAIEDYMGVASFRYELEKGEFSGEEFGPCVFDAHRLAGILKSFDSLRTVDNKAYFEITDSGHNARFDIGSSVGTIPKLLTEQGAYVNPLEPEDLSGEIYAAKQCYKLPHLSTSIFAAIAGESTEFSDDVFSLLVDRNRSVFTIAKRPWGGSTKSLLLQIKVTKASDEVGSKKLYSGELVLKASSLSLLSGCDFIHMRVHMQAFNNNVGFCLGSGFFLRVRQAENKDIAAEKLIEHYDKMAPEKENTVSVEVADLRAAVSLLRSWKNADSTVNEPVVLFAIDPETNQTLIGAVNTYLDRGSTLMSWRLPLDCGGVGMRNLKIALSLLKELGIRNIDLGRVTNGHGLMLTGSTKACPVARCLIGWRSAEDLSSLLELLLQR